MRNCCKGIAPAALVGGIEDDPKPFVDTARVQCRFLLGEARSCGASTYSGNCSVLAKIEQPEHATDRCLIGTHSPCI
jgi:hypothetical protein